MNEEDETSGEEGADWCAKCQRAVVSGLDLSSHLWGGVVGDPEDLWCPSCEEHELWPEFPPDEDEDEDEDYV